jgi:hypothetical protein
MVMEAEKSTHLQLEIWRPRVYGIVPLQVQVQGKEKNNLQLEDNQAEEENSPLLQLCSIQGFSSLDETHEHQGR